MLARAPRKRAPLYKMTPNAQKIIAAVSYLISEGLAAGYKITQYDIVKSVFLADRSHLNKYGRPVTFDNYFAMKDGPVATLTYDLLKCDADQARRYEVEIPWHRTWRQVFRGVHMFMKLRMTWFPLRLFRLVILRN